MEPVDSLMGGAHLRAAAGQASLERLQQAQKGDSAFAAKEMERLFAQMLVKELRSSLKSGLFGEGAGADTYSAWFDEHLGNELADAGVLGLAGQIKASLAKKEER